MQVKCTRAELTILFFDLRDFTKELNPRNHEESEETIMARTAVIAKFIGGVYYPHAFKALAAARAFAVEGIGDGIMAAFEGEGHAFRAVTAAIRVIQGLTTHFTELNEKIDEKRGRGIQIGAGIHTGEGRIVQYAGFLEYSEGSKYPTAGRKTPIGSVVNIASRIEKLNKLHCSHLLISRQTYAALAPKNEGDWNPLGYKNWEGFLYPKE